MGSYSKNMPSDADYFKRWLARYETADKLWFGFRRDSAKQALIIELAHNQSVLTRGLNSASFKEAADSLWKVLEFPSHFAVNLFDPRAFARGLGKEAYGFAWQLTYMSRGFFEYGLGARIEDFARGLAEGDIVNFAKGLVYKPGRLGQFFLGMTQNQLFLFAQGLGEKNIDLIKALGKDNAILLGESFPFYAHGDFRGKWHGYDARSYLKGLGKYKPAFDATLNSMGAKNGFYNNVDFNEKEAQRRSGYYEGESRY